MKEFGADVADLVREVTDDKRLPKEVRKRQQVEKAPYKSPRAKVIKIVEQDFQSRNPSCTVRRKLACGKGRASISGGRARSSRGVAESMLGSKRSSTTSSTRPRLRLRRMESLGRSYHPLYARPLLGCQLCADTQRAASG